MDTELKRKLEEDRKNARQAAEEAFRKLEIIGMNQRRPDVFWQTIFCLLGYSPTQHIQISKNLEDDTKFL